MSSPRGGTVRRKGAALALLLTIFLAGCGRDGPDVDTGRVAARRQVTTTTTAPPPEYRQVAWAKVPRVEVYAAPAAAGAPLHSLRHPTVERQPLAFLAVDRQADWLKVRVPARPNNSTGWIRAADVDLGEIPAHRVLVELGAHRLTLFRGSEAVMETPVAIGKASTPTPLGSFYIDAIVKLSNPNTVWGPYQMSVAGYSEVLKSFLGGVGQIALHGTNRPQLIGGNVSNGCVRLRNDAITKLAQHVSIGTPVDIVA